MFLLGASGHAKVIIDILKAQGVAIDGLFDDNPNCTDLKGYPFLGALKDYKKAIDSLIISIGNNSIRKRIAEDFQNIDYGTAIHPSAILSDDANIGNGTVIMHGAIVQSSVLVGNHCIINTSASIDHDCTIENYVHISPNATLCGNVTVCEGAQVGAGAVVVPGKRIGKWALVAAGAVVVRDVPDYALVIGNPARVIKILK
jgi:sugar O-acyltransferase (sialic acid O-acetyltransferase NeuD family)